MDSAQQTEGETLFQQASQSHQPEVLVKRQFEQRNQNQKSKLANEFIASAGREGISQLAATPDGQHALAVVYDHAGSDGRGAMRQVHEEQGNTAVDYTGRQNNNPGSQSDDPLSVSDAGVEIGPRPNPLQYGAMTSGVLYGLAENTVEGIVQMGVAVGKESEDLKNVDNLEYAGIDEYSQESKGQGLSLPSLEDVGNALKGHVQATNEAVQTAKEKGEYFEAGRAMSNDPMLQMTGLGDMAVFGALARMGKAAKLDTLTSGNAKINGGDGSAGQVSDGKFSRAEGADDVSSVGESDTVRDEVNAPNGNRTVISPAMEEKILLGQRVINGNGVPTNRVRGGHSPEINNSNENYAVEVLQSNSDGTQVIKYLTQFPDGNLSKIKKSTVFPTNWNDADILNAIKQIGNTDPLVIRINDRSSLHRGVVNGVELEVIKIGDDVTSAYPTGGISTPLDRF
jgi:hypothetical protein